MFENWQKLVSLLKILFLIPVSLVTITNCHYTSIPNQECYITWHLEMVWFLNYGFIQVGRVKTDVQFKVS